MPFAGVLLLYGSARDRHLMGFEEDRSTRNLEIPGLVLTHHPGMTTLELTQ